jgi:hypothetical protein
MNKGGGPISPKVFSIKIRRYWHFRRYEDRNKFFRSKMKNPLLFEMTSLFEIFSNFIESFTIYMDQRTSEYKS